ncbi:MAG: hypothetical protein LDL15_02355 [Yonghaparkia sp.]|nr:hypothetical protein [Microcella sp.]
MTPGETPDPDAVPAAPGRLARTARALALPIGVVDLASGSMLLALASGLGLVAPPLLGGFGTALAVGVAGALTLGLARALLGAGLTLTIVVSVARVVSIVGQVLVLLSQTGVAAVVIAAIASLVLTIGLLVVLWLAVLLARRG